MANRTLRREDDGERQSFTPPQVKCDDFRKRAPEAFLQPRVDCFLRLFRCRPPQTAKLRKAVQTRRRAPLRFNQAQGTSLNQAKLSRLYLQRRVLGATARREVGLVLFLVDRQSSFSRAGIMSG
jgi:hypothetical protein